MALEQGDIDQIAEVVNGFLATRLEQVYGAIEQMREEFQRTITVMDGNDHAIIGELRKIQGATPAEVLKMAGESWEHFIAGEARRIGLKMIVAKKATDA